MIDLQQLAVWIIVVCAAWYVVRQVVAQLGGFKKSGKVDTGGCSGCPSGGSANPKLITLSTNGLRQVRSPKQDPVTSMPGCDTKPTDQD